MGLDSPKTRIGSLTIRKFYDFKFPIFNKFSKPKFIISTIKYLVYPRKNSMYANVVGKQKYRNIMLNITNLLYSLSKGNMILILEIVYFKKRAIIS